ncbi:hypothetical protein [Archangium lansingense]|uniref:Secreted protein n=1 Tax=Archangium lansingense TaxID=2995310 RepID=A0ABT3ZXL4_9BACT|nr:hypothetical protein [Archangium lansinium]MCY1074123.1 hypothetical protein [Archangium lansinium]
MKKTLLLSLFSLTLGLLPEVASARSVSAFNGLASHPSEASCWNHGFGGITNNCTATRRWCMPLTVDPAGSYNVYIAAYGASPSNNVGCFATGVNRELTAAWSSATTYLPAFGSSQVISLSGAYVPPGGSLYACCDVAPGGRLNNVLW